MGVKFERRTTTVPKKEEGCRSVMVDVREGGMRRDQEGGECEDDFPLDGTLFSPGF